MRGLDAEENLRSMIRLPGSINQRRRHPLRGRRPGAQSDSADQLGPKGRRTGRKPRPSSVLGAKKPCPVRRRGPRPASGVRALPMLHVTDIPPGTRAGWCPRCACRARSILDPVVGVHATLAAAHLHEPRPDRRCVGVNAHSPRRHDIWIGQEVVTGQRHTDLFLGCTPRQAGLPQESQVAGGRRGQQHEAAQDDGAKPWAHEHTQRGDARSNWTALDRARATGATGLPGGGPRPSPALASSR